MVDSEYHYLPKDADALGRATEARTPSLYTGEESLLGRPLPRHLSLHGPRPALEERLIQMTKSGQAVFWVGGPGEEAFSICLGMMVKKGCGPAFDYLHLHYRNTAVLIPMGLDMIEATRQILTKVTDANSMGRNFVSHYARHHANVIPVSSVVEVQYVMAPGTALMQKRHAGGDGVSVVLGGDAGAAEGDFTSCLNWSTRAQQHLPVLIIVMNNGWGISTSYKEQYGGRSLTEITAAYGIDSEVVDGNDPIASWHALQRAMQTCRVERRPYLIEARVSRLYGHSSASGANRYYDEPDCLTMFQERLLEAGVLKQDDIDRQQAQLKQELDMAVAQALAEPDPRPKTSTATRMPLARWTRFIPKISPAYRDLKEITNSKS